MTKIDDNPTTLHAALAVIEQLRGRLAWYADPANYRCTIALEGVLYSAIELDEGDRAREVTKPPAAILGSIKNVCPRCDGAGDLLCGCIQPLEGCRHIRYPDLYPPPAERERCPGCAGTGIAVDPPQVQV